MPRSGWTCLLDPLAKNQAGGPERRDAAWQTRLPNCPTGSARWPCREAPQRSGPHERRALSESSIPPKSPAARLTRRPRGAVPASSCRNVELASLAQHKPCEQKCECTRNDRDALPRIGRNVGRGRCVAGVRENHLGDGRITQARFRAALVGHFDLDRVGARINPGIGNRGFNLLGIDFLGTEIWVGFYHPERQLRG